MVKKVRHPITTGKMKGRLNEDQFVDILLPRSPVGVMFNMIGGENKYDEYNRLLYPPKGEYISMRTREIYNHPGRRIFLLSGRLFSYRGDPIPYYEYKGDVRTAWSQSFSTNVLTYINSIWNIVILRCSEGILDGDVGYFTKFDPYEDYTTGETWFKVEWTSLGSVYEDRARAENMLSEYVEKNP